MKLYTEEQVKQMLDMYVDYVMFYTTADEILNEHTPIELPTDEEIEKASTTLLMKKYPYHPPQDGGYWKDMFREGAKWYREQSKLKI